MANDKYATIQKYFDPQYDSDVELDEDEQKKIKTKEQNREYSEASDLRKKAWDKADMYPKLKKFVKGAWYGDKQKDE